MNSLTTRLLSGTLLLLAILATTSWITLTQAARAFSDELTQQLNGSIAMYVAQESPLIQDGRPDTAQLTQLARQAMIINPIAEVYLLDSRGRIIGSRNDVPSSGLDAVNAPLAKDVDLAPIAAFMRNSGSGPTYGVDPRHADRMRVFSAAEVRVRGKLEGYVYVVLGGSRAAGLRDTLSSSYILRAALSTVSVILLLVALAAWALTVWLTRPIRALHARALELGKQLDAGSLTAQARQADTLDAVRVVFEALAMKLHAQIRALRESDRLRRELFANISHDLRTPLTAMRGYLDTMALQIGDTGSDRGTFLAIASRHCDRLNRLVDQIFALARLEAGGMRLRPERVSLAELAQDICGKYQLSAEKFRVSLQLDIDPGVSDVTADIGLIETVLENLLDNAMRHSAPGTQIVIGVSAVAGQVRTAISDQGSGIEAADLQRIRERFEVGNGGRTGLGLAIVARVLALHGSALEISSTPGKGTIAAFALPALPLAEAAVVPGPAAQALPNNRAVMNS